jgi:O-antigen ligase
MANDNPLTGVGIDNFYVNYFFYSPHWDGLNHAVHSTWFGVLAETGYLGFIIFCACIGLVLHTNLKSLSLVCKHEKHFPTIIKTTVEALFAGMIGTLAAGTFLTFGFSWPIYILGAMTISLSQWVDQFYASNISPHLSSIMETKKENHYV